MVRRAQLQVKQVIVILIRFKKKNSNSIIKLDIGGRRVVIRDSIVECLIVD